jgi:hypothetical protein
MVLVKENTKKGPNIIFWYLGFEDNEQNLISPWAKEAPLNFGKLCV